MGTRRLEGVTWGEPPDPHQDGLAASLGWWKRAAKRRSLVRQDSQRQRWLGGRLLHRVRRAQPVHWHCLRALESALEQVEGLRISFGLTTTVDY
jgi:hypothetical protein